MSKRRRKIQHYDDALRELESAIWLADKNNLSNLATHLRAAHEIFLRFRGRKVWREEINQ